MSDAGQATKISSLNGSWTRIASAPPAFSAPLPDPMEKFPALPDGLKGLAQGANRSYGKTGLNPGGALWLGAARDRLMEFDRANGVIEVQGGVSLAEIARLAIPAGWFLPVMPGTAWATVAGAIANDVHGKNHHLYGSFGSCVQSVALARSDEDCVRTLSRAVSPDLFAATLGGWGLTGLIHSATLQLKPVRNGQMVVSSQRFESLGEFFGLEARRLAAGEEHVVAWVDCMASGPALGRGIMLSGRHAADGEESLLRGRAKAGLSAPPFIPGGLLAKPLLQAFNALYWRQPEKHNETVDAMKWLFPLDAIGSWNRGYGPRGFYQWQGRFPKTVAPEALADALRLISKSGQGSFLAVLKSFGPKKTPAQLTFAEEGVTLALDFPNHGDKTLPLLARLDRLALEAGGALYPAKDWRMDAKAFEASFPQWREWAVLRDPGMSSAFSRQTMGF